MEKISKEVLKAIANNLMFDMTDEEYESVLVDFELFLKQVELINEVPDVDLAEPMVFPYDISSNFLRDDVPGTPLALEDVLRNAPETEDGQIKLPKVVK